MQSKIEGIILSKLPYQERHLLCQVLLRTGKRVGVLFYGGRGGGKKQKSSIIELGFMLSIELNHSHKDTEIYHAKEWSLIWHHDLIRLNLKAFYTKCFFLEIVSKISMIENLRDPLSHTDEMQGIFTCLSNALVILEKSLVQDAFSKEAHQFIFFAKLFSHSGIFPDRDRCALCSVSLNQESDPTLISERGGFACSQCYSHQGSNFHLAHFKSPGRELWESLGFVSRSRYIELDRFTLENKSIPRLLFHYFCYQNHFEERDFKTASLVF